MLVVELMDTDLWRVMNDRRFPLAVTHAKGEQTNTAIVNAQSSHICTLFSSSEAFDCLRNCCNIPNIFFSCLKGVRSNGFSWVGFSS